MWGFLKKKLTDGIERLKAAIQPKEEAEAEAVAEIGETLAAAAEAKTEIAYKEQLIEGAGYAIKPEIEQIVKKPYQPQLEAEAEIVAEREGILAKVRKAITEKRISEADIRDVLWNLQLGLIEADVALPVAEKITADIRNALVGKSVKRTDDAEKIVRAALHKSVTEILAVDGLDLLAKLRAKKPFVIVFLGFNGGGKTSSIAKLGWLLKQHGISCVFAAADTWRAAAIEQLTEHGERLGITVIKHRYGADPAAVIFDAIRHATAKGIDVVLADTAGRSHANVNLMDEMQKIVRVNKPDLKILVLDALTGNDVYEQCRLFNEAVGVDGLIITKVDVYDKGGAALSAAWTIRKPLLYLGVGQGYADLQRFDAEKVVNSLISAQ